MKDLAEQASLRLPGHEADKLTWGNVMYQLCEMGHGSRVQHVYDDVTLRGVAIGILGEAGYAVYKTEEGQWVAFKVGVLYEGHGLEPAAILTALKHHAAATGGE